METTRRAPGDQPRTDVYVKWFSEWRDMNYQQTGQVSLTGGPQVWDPGARILIYSDNSKTNTGLETKEKTKHSKQSRFLNTRASPNKSQDSGFSDSGESETSTASETKGGDFKI